MKSWARAALTATAALILVGCSGDAADSTMDGGDPATWAPVEITQEMNGEVIELVVGQGAIFTEMPTGENVSLATSNPDAVQVFDPRTEGDAVYLAGLEAVGTGASHVLVVDGFMADGPFEVLNSYIIQVFDPNSDAAPGNEMPTMLTEPDESITMIPGQTAAFPVFEDSGFSIATSSDMIVMMLPNVPVPTVIAVGTGTATVQVLDENNTPVATANITVN
jgi:hypothetical protein